MNNIVELVSTFATIILVSERKIRKVLNPRELKQKNPIASSNCVAPSNGKTNNTYKDTESILVRAIEIHLISTRVESRINRSIGFRDIVLEKTLLFREKSDLKFGLHYKGTYI